MEKNKGQTLKRIVVFGFMFMLAGIIALAGTILHKGEMEEMLRNTVMVMTGTGMVIFSFAMEEINKRFIYRNEGRYGRFSLMYLGGLLAAVFLPYLPVTGWPFLVIFVLLGVFSDTATGVMAGSVCLLLSVHFAGGDFAIFWLYFVSGVVGCLVFSMLDDEFRVMLPLFISLAVLTLCLTANEILFTPVKLSAAQFLIPAINLLVCCILLLISLKIFSSAVIHRNREKYMDITDP